jgi:long-subunit fatty acid transport protein
MSVLRAALTAWLAACALCSGPIARAELVLDASGSYTYDDNVPNGLENDDRLSDQILTVGVVAGIYEQLGTGTGLSAALLIEQTGYVQYSGLTNLAAGARIGVRHKFGLGGQAPWVGLSGQALYRNYHYDYRDGWQYDAALTAGKALTERLSLQASVRYDDFHADQLQPTVLPGISTAAYDVSGWTFGLRLAYGVTDADLLWAGYAYRDGSVTAVTQLDFEVLEYSTAVARDKTFGSTPRRAAYRLDGHSDLWSIGWTHALSGHLAMTAAYAYRRFESAGDLDPYYANVVSLTLGYSR